MWDRAAGLERVRRGRRIAGRAAGVAVGLAVGVGAVTALSTPVGAFDGDTAPDIDMLVVIGDSISQGTGSNGPGSPGGPIGQPRLAASWATGDHPGLDSYADRLERVVGRSIERVNLSANGATMLDDFVDQVTRVPEAADLVLVQMGGNDVCRPDESQMTSVEEYRDQFRSGLAWLSQYRPDTLVNVSSIPDIYGLWYVRGAPHRGEQWPFIGSWGGTYAGPRPERTAVENDNKRIARLLWNTLGVVPCQTMLDEANRPTNTGPTPDSSHPAEQRRLRVRAHVQALNAVLASECAAVVQCRYDGGAVFDLVANRDAEGRLIADPNRWGFVDADISTQDHFHPSFQGQAKLAAVVWEHGFDWSDGREPSIGISLGGRDDAPVARVGNTLEIRADDAAGIRALDYRVIDRSPRSAEMAAAPVGAAAGALRADGRWRTRFVDGLSLSLDHPGRYRLEVTALDRNGRRATVVHEFDIWPDHGDRPVMVPI